MKKILYAVILALVALTGCKKEEKQLTVADKLCGEWRGSELSVEAAIYMSFTSDGTFELYQKTTDSFELRRGKWSVAGDILSGTYNDGEAWAASYKVSVSEGTLTMVSQDESAETNVYRKCEIPEQIKTGSTVVVKSSGAF